MAGNIHPANHLSNTREPVGEISKSRTTRKIDQQVWDEHKEHIRRLYLGEKKTLNQVSEILERERGFTASKSQYIHMVNEVWGFRKNMTRSDVMSIEAQKRKRVMKGKESVVRVDGRIIEDKEFQRKKSRHFQTVLEQHQQRFEDITEEVTTGPADRIEISTPSPGASLSMIGMGQSVSRLPSPLRMDDQADWMMSWMDVLSTPLRIPSPSPSTLLGSIGQLPLGNSEKLPSFVFQNPFSYITPSMRFDIAFETQITPIFQVTTSPLFIHPENNTIIKQLSSSTPVKNPDQWLSDIRSSILGKSHSPTEFLLFLKSYMIRLSNNIDEPFVERQCIDKLLKSGLVEEYLIIVEKIIKESRAPAPEGNIISAPMNGLGQILEDFGPVVRKFSIVLLYGAARTGNIEVLRMLLDLGILNVHGDEAILRNHLIGVTAIQFAIEYQHAAAYNLLLRQKLKLATSPISDLSPSILWTAVLVDSPDLVSDLVTRYAMTDVDLPWFFGANAVKVRNYLADLQKNGLTWSEELLSNLGAPNFEIVTALELSVWTRRIDCFRILATYHTKNKVYRCLSSPAPRNNNSSLPRKDRVVLLYLAVLNADHQMMREILQHPRLFGYIDEPIHRTGVEIKPETPLERALFRGDINAIKILLQNGADLKNVELRFGSLSPRARQLEIKTRLPPLFRRHLEENGLPEVANVIEEMVQQAKAEEKWDPLFHGSDSEAEDDADLDWTYRVEYCTVQTVSVIIKICDWLFGDSPIWDSSLWETFIGTHSKFLKWMEITITLAIVAGTNEKYAVTRIYGGFHDEETARLLRRAFRRLFAGTSWRLTLYPLVPMILEVIVPNSPHTRSKIRQLGAQYGYAPKKDSRECFLRKLDEFFVIDLALKPGDSNYAEAYNSQTGSRFLSNLEKTLHKYTNELGYIYEGSAGIPDSKFHRKLCEITIPQISQMTEPQILALLSLAIRFNFTDVIEVVLVREPNFMIPGTMFSEVAWFSNEESFRLILGHYSRTSKEGSKGLEMALLLSIIQGDSFKAIELVKYANLGYNYGCNKTALSAAVMLGRLDISNILIEAGAPDDLNMTKELAMNCDFFDIAEFIGKKLVLEESDSIVTSPHGPATDSALDSEDDEIDAGSD
ncbi:hypothetical protein TWF694_006427 [Orbilia ellipsospora]|uniref:Clr5 domain-containing protein n=1 Tax=Orbilia ellipsospora TaxID=2528407 RepID=A0AAV9XMM5_9PEZI